MMMEFVNEDFIHEREQLEENQFILCEDDETRFRVLFVW